MILQTTGSHSFDLAAGLPTNVRQLVSQSKNGQTMKYILYLFLVGWLTSCEKNKVNALSSCNYPWENLTRTDRFIQEVPATVAAVHFPGQQPAYHILRGGNSAALGSCNLPEAFKKDSLKVMVSGYFLTFPGMDLMNINPLPFEVTAVKRLE